jgi:hypothetical protein
VAVAYLVYKASNAIDKINPFTDSEGKPDSKLATQVTIGAVVVIALAFLLKD